ncbi:MAG TPA: S9 family peptidase [Brevundimonas sp.]|nr:S9 family peptidase [Brevundimonas sp.]
MMIRYAAGALGAAGLFLTAAAAAQDTAPLEAYGALPAHELVEVSPSGDRLAYVTVVGEERALVINDLNDMSLIGGVRAGAVKVRDIGWVGEDHVYIFSTATQTSASIGLRRSELADASIYEIPTRRVSLALNNTPGVFAKVFGSPIVRTIDGEPSLVVIGQGREGAGMFRVNLSTGIGREHVDPDKKGPPSLLDAEGRPVARATYDGQNYEVQARRGGFWRTMWRTDARIDAPSLAGFGQTPNTVVLNGVIDGRPEGFYALDLETGAISGLPFEGKPTSLIHHPMTRLLVGARTLGSDDSVSWQFLDPAAERSWRAVQTAFRGKQVTLTSWSNDLKQIVVFTQGAGDSGTYQLVDLDRRTAEIIGEAYPEITGARVGEVRSISYAAADGMRIPGYLTLPPGVTDPKGLPLVVFPHGGPASRDYLGFDWWAQAMASRGYAVLQPNFRGSDGLGTAHLEAGYGEWGRKMQSDLSDGVRWLASEGIVDPARVCIVGASYGGYAAMAGPTLDPGVYRCAVAVSGVADLRRMVEWSAEQGGRRDSPVVRYWNRFMGADRLGDRDLDQFSPSAQAARADAPIMMLHGRDDTVVPFEQSRILADALRRAGKPFELIELPSEDHWLSRAATRRWMLIETVRFLEQHNPPR